MPGVTLHQDRCRKLLMWIRTEIEKALAAVRELQALEIWRRPSSPWQPPDTVQWS